MNRRAESLLRNALVSCQSIAEYVEGRTYDDYLANKLLRRGVERELEIAGEALNHAAIEDDTIAELLPDLRAIVGLRNRLIHGYRVIDNRAIWDIAHEHAPQLAEQLRALLD